MYIIRLEIEFLVEPRLNRGQPPGKNCFLRCSVFLILTLNPSRLSWNIALRLIGLSESPNRLSDWISGLFLSPKGFSRRWITWACSFLDFNWRKEEKRDKKVRDWDIFLRKKVNFDFEKQIVKWLMKEKMRKLKKFDFLTLKIEDFSKNRSEK